MHEKYSINVCEESVEIYGDLTIEETFDFLSFFERKGYKSVVMGCENTTLRMLNTDQKEVIYDTFVKDLKEEILCYQDLFTKERESHEKTLEKLKEVEALKETNKKIKNLEEELCQKINQVTAIKDIIKVLIKNDHIYPGKIGHVITALASCCKEEKEEDLWNLQSGTTMKFKA
jgi:hypothetical protein